ncbi:hypothetical protein MRB53_039445 [Persea americana]|nr:hypothetical protein MRB53_039445 [Persea americana]
MAEGGTSSKGMADAGLAASEDKKSCSASPHDAPNNAPKKPNPSTDPGVIPQINDKTIEEDGIPVVAEDMNVMSMDPLVALKLLSRGIQALTEMTGDIPVTPLAMPLAKRSLSNLRKELGHQRTNSRPGTPPSAVSAEDLKHPSFKNVEIGSPEAHASEPYADSGEEKEQYAVLARKFFSKRPPPISIDDYLLRLHRYCPMSTAVYLAAGVYIHKLAIDDKLLPVTVRTVHRLLLSSLRVAMKALEDLSYPHKRFAGVGGVSEAELAKLELSLCYMVEFELKVNNELLKEKMQSLQHLHQRRRTNSGAAMCLSLPLKTRGDRRTSVS